MVVWKPIFVTSQLLQSLKFGTLLSTIHTTDHGTTPETTLVWGGKVLTNPVLIFVSYRQEVAILNLRICPLSCSFTAARSGWCRRPDPRLFIKRCDVTKGDKLCRLTLWLSDWVASSSDSLSWLSKVEKENVWDKFYKLHDHRYHGLFKTHLSTFSLLLW